MAEMERTKVRERGEMPKTLYEQFMQLRREFHERQTVGKVVIKAADREVQQNRQGRILYYLNPLQYKDTPLQDWIVFINDIRTHSGKHRHQGGLVIYVLEGEGYSIVDGERIDWKKGDLLLLPIKPKGVEHQHFNTQAGQDCKWMAFVYTPIMEHVAMEIAQIEVSPDYKGD
jgi:gentisate 1,2-dioxygenase